TVLSGAATLRLPTAPVSFSISDSFTITAAVLFGPAAGTLSVAFDSLAISFRLASREFPLRRFLFNATAPALAMWTASHVFFWMAGAAAVGEQGSPLEHLIAPLAIFTALYFGLNSVLVAGAVALEQRAPLVTTWRRYFAPLWLTFYGGAAVAALLIVLAYARGPSLTIIVLVAPIPLILYATFK